jgi:acyl-coenzyme A thioesterase PaaI-like protein
MLADRVNHLLQMLKTSKVKLFDTEICGQVNFHGIFKEKDKELMHFGLEIKQSNCNVHLTMHGGAYSTLIDCLTTIHTWTLDPQQRIAISTELSVSFYAAASKGQYVDIFTDVLAIDQNLAKATAMLYVNSSPIARGSHSLFFLEKSIDSLVSKYQH